MRHKWTREDDILTFYLYRYGEESNITLDNVCKHMGFSDPGSIKMRIKNFEAVDGKVGLVNYSKLTESIYIEFKNISKEVHLDKCLEILGSF
jgi:hypothetical protein